MASIELIEEKPITLSEMKNRLEEVEKRDKELNFRANKTKDYLGALDLHTLKKVDELRKKVNDLAIPRLKDRHIVKMIDVMPGDLDSLKIIFSGENITLKEDDLKKILKVIN
jgi:DNA-directed RNA polymerase subunit F